MAGSLYNLLSIVHFPLHWFEIPSLSNTAFPYSRVNFVALILAVYFYADPRIFYYCSFNIFEYLRGLPLSYAQIMDPALKVQWGYWFL